MTKNYIEIIKRSPYYYQVDGILLENKCPDRSCHDIWQTWKHNLPDFCEKERVFLDLVVLEQKNKRSFMETMKLLEPKLDKDFLEFVENEKAILEQMYRSDARGMVIPSESYWHSIKKNLHNYDGIMETVPQFFLRIATQYYRNDWTATQMCFHNLLSGKILMGIEPYRKHTCFVAETPIWTTDSIKNISQVQVGDYVATHNGRFCRVVKTFKNPRRHRPLYRVYSVLGEVAIATHDHPFLVYSTEYKQILWKNVSELEHHTDFLLRSNITGLHSFHLSSHFKDYPAMNRFLHKHPRIVGESLSKMMGNQGKVTTEHHEVKDCFENLQEDDQRVYQDIVVLLTDRKIRMMIWKWVLETNHYLFVKGWWDCFQSKTYFDDKEEAEMVMMVLNLYKYNVILKKSYLTYQWYITKHSSSMFCCFEQNNFLLLGDKVFVRFSHKRQYSRQYLHPFVYTLGVERDHSFTVNGYVVKNCTGTTPDTMILTEHCLVPIVELQAGDYILDKAYQKRKIRNLIKHHYEGIVVSLDNCSTYTASTPIFMKNGKDCKEMIQILNAHETIASPILEYYYKPTIDKQYSSHYLNFLLHYLCDWKIIEENGWFHWNISLSDHLFIVPVLSTFHSFQYRFHTTHVQFQKHVLTVFIDKQLHQLLHICRNKLQYFFSYLDRKKKNCLSHTQFHFCNTLRSFLHMDNTQRQLNYVGDIYDIDMEGDGFCTSNAIVKKDFKVGLDSRHLPGVSLLYLSDSFFQQINREGSHEQNVSEIWQDIVSSQIHSGKPSIICVDRNKNECVSGDTRILTHDGVVPISSKKDEIVSVWNGTHFTDVMITRTGCEKKFLKIHLSNGLCLTCTPYHKLFIMSENSEIIKVNASEIHQGHEIAPFQLPSVSTMDVLPSSIVMTLEWIAKRCVYIEKGVVLFDRDVESLKDILLDLQYCGLKSEITYNHNRNEYELRIDKTRWNLLNYRHLNKHISFIEGDVVRNLHVIKVEESQQYQESFCFHEPFSGTSIFEGVATGQCENMSDVMCVQGFLDISKFLKPNPLKKQLENHRVIVYTYKNCPFLQLLQLEYKDLEIKEIEIWQEEWQLKRHVHALSSVPAIFLDHLYVGNFMDFWKHYLCPVFDTETLRQVVYSLCQSLDSAIDQETNILNEFCFLSNRPIVLYVRGLRELFIRMKLSIEEEEALQLNKLIFETIYYAAMKASCDLSAQKGPCINTQKIYSMFETMLTCYENLYPHIVKYGFRNMIFVKTCQEDETHMTTRYFEQLKKHVGCGDIPNSLKQIYQDDYKLCQRQRLKLMQDRKRYHVVDDIFHLYVDENMGEDELSEIQQEIWAEGFHTIQIHERKTNK